MNVEKRKAYKDIDRLCDLCKYTSWEAGYEAICNHQTEAVSEHMCDVWASGTCWGFRRISPLEER